MLIASIVIKSKFLLFFFIRLILTHHLTARLATSHTTCQLTTTCQPKTAQMTRRLGFRYVSFCIVFIFIYSPITAAHTTPNCYLTHHQTSTANRQPPTHINTTTNNNKNDDDNRSPAATSQSPPQHPTTQKKKPKQRV
jgi:hypothetical protein